MTLPIYKNMYEYENNYLLSTKPERVGKFLTHFKLMEIIKDVPGDIVEFGIFKGASFSRLAHFRNLLSLENSKKLIGFDIFGTFPNAQNKLEKYEINNFIEDAGNQSITKKQLESVLKNNGCYKNTELIQGDIKITLKQFLYDNPAMRFSLINLDVDLSDVTELILEECYSRLSIGGIIMLDDYTFFAGATNVIDQFCNKHKLAPKSSVYSKSPSYIVKELI